MEFLRLPRSYKNGKIIIPAGDYAEDDSALCGQFQYLLDTDHAELVQLPSNDPTPAKKTEQPPPKSKG